MTISSKPQVDFRLYGITDSSLLSEEQFLNLLKTAVDSGIKAIQLREKHLSAIALLQLAETLKTICRDKTKLIINDRLDIAMAVKANGVHLTAKSLPAPTIRKLSADNFLIGSSTHSLEEIKQAEKSGCDFVLFGPVFETESKKQYGPPQGLKNLETVAANTTLPVFAVGGITPENTEVCIKSGAHGIAVISAIMTSRNISKTFDDFRKTLGTL